MGIARLRVGPTPPPFAVRGSPVHFTAPAAMCEAGVTDREEGAAAMGQLDGGHSWRSATSLSLHSSSRTPVGGECCLRSRTPREFLICMSIIWISGEKTVEWVLCHRLATLEEITHLVEDHLMVSMVADGTPFSLSLLSFSLFLPPLVPATHNLRSW